MCARSMASGLPCCSFSSLSLYPRHLDTLQPVGWAIPERHHGLCEVERWSGAELEKTALQPSTRSTPPTLRAYYEC